jgi:hypothetical protein
MSPDVRARSVKRGTTSRDKPTWVTGSTLNTGSSVGHRPDSHPATYAPARSPATGCSTPSQGATRAAGRLPGSIPTDSAGERPRSAPYASSTKTLGDTTAVLAVPASCVLTATPTLESPDNDSGPARERDQTT